MNTVVKFNTVKEFVEEMQKNVKDASIDDLIVRVTKNFVRSSSYPLVFVHVVATYKSKSDLVKLDKYAGDAFESNSEDAMTTKTMTFAEKITTDLEEKIKELHLEVRAGMYQLEDKQ